MAGGSQLSQLKARIKSEGISDRRQQSKSAKNKKKQNNNKNAKQSPDESAAARAARLAAIVGDNPFESKITKQKHQVLTLKKPKTIAGKPGAAKQAAISARQAQLLPEYHARAKAGSFVDRRFGENDPTLTPEERMLERFTKEKQRRSARNSSAFNLNDGEDDFQLTHYGQSLSGLDGLDDIPLDDDDEEGGLSGNIDKNTTSRSHFGGFQEKEQDGDQDGEERKKSKAEVMSEIIAKSKFAKHERQKVKDADDDLRHELDAELGDIRGLLFSMPPVENKDSKEDEEAAKDKAKAYGDPSKSGPNAIPLGGKKAVTAEEKKKTEAESEIDPATSSSLSKPNLIGNSYDAFVRELAFDRRAKPTDRLKTEAELAAEQAELLQKQERARLKRMRGERDDSDEDDDGTSRKRGRKGGAPQGDDLDDDFVFDGETAADVYGLGRGLGDMSDEDGQDEEEDGDDDVDLEDLEEEGDSKEEDIADGDDSEDEDGEDEDDDDEDDGEEGDDEFQDMVDPNALAQPGEDEDEDIGGDHQDLVTETRKSSKKDKSPSSTKAKESAPAPTLPFTFPCPRTHAEFLDLLEKHQVQPSDVPTVVKRIRTLYHASLAEENKFKLQAILGVLLDHALYVAGLKGRHDASGSAKGGYDLVNALIPPIFELTKTYPLVSAQHFVAKLTLMQRNLQRGLAAGALLPTSRTWPKSGGELVLLRIAGAVWPTSDWQHPVSTPRSLLLAQYLAHARLRCTGDVACALYLVSLVVEGEAFSRRIVPEALNALGQCMVLLGAAAIEATEEGWKRVQEAQVQWGLPMPDVGAEHTRNVGIALQEESSNAEDEVTRSLPFMLNLGVEQDAKDPATSQAVASQLLHSTFTLVERFAKLYNGSTAFVELFEPFLALLSAFPAEGAGLSPRTGQAMIHLTHSLSRQVSLAASSRRSLRLQAHRAVSIASYVPKFDQDGRGGASRLRGGVFDPNPERAEASKLRAQLKQEKKGAMRELRRDNAFLAEVREGERREEEKSYKRKMDKIMSGLQEERSEEKALAREKAKLKRRAGGK